MVAVSEKPVECLVLVLVLVRGPAYLVGRRVTGSRTNENEDEQETVATFVGTFVGLGFFDKVCD
jgi:hypothetical protein